MLQKRCAYLEASSAQFSIEKFKASDEDFQFHTGLSSYDVFQKLLRYLKVNTMKQDDNTCNQEREVGRPALLSTENVFSSCEFETGSFSKGRRPLFQRPLEHGEPHI